MSNSFYAYNDDEIKLLKVSQMKSLMWSFIIGLTLMGAFLKILKTMLFGPCNSITIRLFAY